MTNNFKNVEKHIDDLMLDVGIAMSRRMMLSTYPLGVSQKKGKHGLKAGEGALYGDISRQNNSIAQASYRLKERGQTTRARQFAKLMRLNDISDALKIAQSGGITLVQSSTPSHRYKKSNHDYSDTLIISSHTLKKYKKEQGEKVGYAKSGWVAPSGSWYSKRQKWIKRHGSNGSFQRFKNKIVIRNRVKYATDAQIKNCENNQFQIALKGVLTKFNKAKIK